MDTPVKKKKKKTGSKESGAAKKQLKFLLKCTQSRQHHVVMKPQ